MRFWGIVLVAACAWSPSPKQPPKAMVVEYLGDAQCSVIGSRFIGAERGCTVELSVSIDADLVPDPAGYQLEVKPPYGAELPPVAMDSGSAVVSVPVTGPTSAWRGRPELVLRLRAPGDAHAEIVTFEMTTVDPIAAPVAAWLWTSYWALDDARLGAGAEPACDGNLGVVTFVGGDLTAAATIVVDVYDEDVGGGGMHLDTVELSASGMRRHDAYPAHLCDDDSPGSSLDHVDPNFDTKLLDPGGMLLDEVAGYALDSD